MCFLSRASPVGQNSEKGTEHKKHKKRKRDSSLEFVLQPVLFQGILSFIPQILKPPPDFDALLQVLAARFKDQWTLVVRDDQLFDKSRPIQRAFERPQMLVLLSV